MNNKLPQITFIYNRYKKASPTKPAVVEMRILYDKKQKYISTGIKLYPNQWKNGVIINHEDALTLCEILNKLLSNVRQILYQMIEEKDIDIYQIPYRLKQLEVYKITFLNYCKKRAEIRQFGKTKDSKERYDRFIRLFTAWGGIKDFKDINEKNIISYDVYLMKKGMKTYSKWNNYHRFLNSFILDAIDDGLLKRNPYKWINIEKGKNIQSINRCLTPGEFSKIKHSKMPTESLERVRDLFIFQTYTCLAYTDLDAFDATLIREVKGTQVYLGNRKKTSKIFTIPLLTPAIEILHKYNGKLPIISNVKYNSYLKLVAQASGIEKPISSHWARHTGATLLLNEGVDMKIVSKICGHSSTRITEQVYAKLLDETVVDAVSDIKI